MMMIIIITIGHPKFDVWSFSGKETYDARMANARKQAAGEPAVIVIDGNQKLTRRTCCHLMSTVQKVPRTNLLYLQDCTETPVYKGSSLQRHFLFSTSSSSSSPACSLEKLRSRGSGGAEACLPGNGCKATHASTGGRTTSAAACRARSAVCCAIYVSPCIQEATWHAGRGHGRSWRLCDMSDVEDESPAEQAVSWLAGCLHRLRHGRFNHGNLRR